MNKKDMNWLKAGILGLSIGGFCGIGLYRFHYAVPTIVAQSGPIFNYQKDRDHDAIINLFERERFWLTVSDYDPVFMLKYMAPYKDFAHKDTMHIWVAREGDQFVGFTACYFYLDKPGVGRILFLATEPAFRGKGYGKKLVQHALTEFKKMGAWKVEILTRNSNYPAQKVYTGLGFVEKSRDQGDRGHVYYDYFFD